MNHFHSLLLKWTCFSHTAMTRPSDKGGGALFAGNAVALLVFGPVMP